MASDKVVYKSVPIKEKINDVSTPEAPRGIGMRHIQAFILFVSLSVAYSMRAQLSVSMVAMTNVHDSSIIKANHMNFHNESKTENVFGNSSNIANETSNKNMKPSGWCVYQTYDWAKSTQEMIMFSFFVGYTSMMIPMGIIAQRFGGKLPILIALAANGVLSILTPWLPMFGGWVAVCACRLLQGCTQAAFYPSIHTMLGKWAPLSERGRLSTYIYTGSQFGTVVAFQIAGLFAGSPVFGWPSTFWFCGAASLMCFGLFYWLGAATPHDHSKITTEELAYIIGDSNADMAVKKRKTPWKHILTSSAVWALVTSHAGSAVGYLFILTQMPTYMNKILQVDIKNNGLYSSLPYISMYLMTLLFGYLSDLFANRKYMSVANIRRTANSIGMAVSAIFLIAFSYVKSTLLGVVILILCLGMHSGVHVGFHINQIDIAPNFAGPIMALGNMVANLTSLMVPVFLTNIVGDDLTNQHKWQIMFIIISSIQILTNVIFVIFVKGEVQPWNFYGDDEFETEKDGTSMSKLKNAKDVMMYTGDNVIKISSK